MIPYKRGPPPFSTRVTTMYFSCQMIKTATKIMMMMMMLLMMMMMMIIVIDPLSQASLYVHRAKIIITTKLVFQISKIMQVQMTLLKSEMLKHLEPWFFESPTNLNKCFSWLRTLNHLLLVFPSIHYLEEFW